MHTTARFHCRTTARWMAAPLVAALVLSLHLPATLGPRDLRAAEPKAKASDARRPSARPSASPDLLVVGEEEPWITALAAPVIARLRQDRRAALMFAVSYPPSRRANWLISQIAPQRPVVLASAESVSLGPALEKCSPEVLTLGIDPVYASLRIAKRFWQRPRQAVVAPADDIEALLLGASLAGNLSIPLLIRDSAESRKTMSESLDEAGVEEALLVVTDPDRGPRWTNGKNARFQVLSRRAILDRLIAGLGPENVRNVVLARLPDPKDGTGSTSWLAPYLSLARGAPLVLCHTSSAAAAEAEVAELIDRYRLRPRTVTILADYRSIGTELVEMEVAPPAPVKKPKGGPRGASGSNGATAPASPAAPPPAGETVAQVKKTYEVNKEPCIPTQARKPVSLGVGRIPMESLADASVLFARGLLRERTLAARPGRVLMVSNSGLQRRPLPLCEAISRVTAQEFKNCRVPLDEFYGKLADSPEVMAAVRGASLILYEGHVSYQDMIDVAYGHAIVPDTYYEEAVDALENNTPDAVAVPRPDDTPAATPPVPAPAEKPSRLVEPLGEMPIVVLQSCESLDEQLLDRIDELGGVAGIGSVTAIHSGSGSMLVQALADGVLYYGDTLGESLRDAQNYLFCVGDLKIDRGLKEQAKSRRVALSFRLWGDPELPVLRGPLREPRQTPVTAQWTASGELNIRVPAKRFPEVSSSRYCARMFPGSQSAGLVKKEGDAPVRRVLPAYYVRVPLPEGIAAEDISMDLPGGGLCQTAFRVDPLRRLLYVVYLPEVDRPGETIVLRCKTAAK